MRGFVGLSNGRINTLVRVDSNWSFKTFLVKVSLACVKLHVLSRTQRHVWTLESPPFAHSTAKRTPVIEKASLPVLFMSRLATFQAECVDSPPFAHTVPHLAWALSAVSPTLSTGASSGSLSAGSPPARLRLLDSVSAAGIRLSCRAANAFDRVVRATLCP